MVRTLSWIDRIYPIAQTVASSARCRCSSRELEQLFQILPPFGGNSHGLVVDSATGPGPPG
jgi:hypothetical protein